MDSQPDPGEHFAHGTERHRRGDPARIGTYGMKDTEIPLISPQLIVALKARFPLPIPRLDDQDRAIWHRLGSWSVIQFLELKLKEQQEK